jgi:microcystin-dependent protein
LHRAARHLSGPSLIASRSKEPRQNSSIQEQTVMSESYLSEIRIFSFGFAPKGWALCNGQLLPINQNQALFSLLGTTYGGDGRTNFALPNLQGRVPIHFDGSHLLGQVGGATAVTLNHGTMAAHSHPMQADSTTSGTAQTPTTASVLGISAGRGNPAADFNVSIYNSAGPGAALASQVIGNIGGGQPHINQQPYLTLNFSIALQGVFPSRN